MHFPLFTNRPSFSEFPSLLLLFFFKCFILTVEESRLSKFPAYTSIRWGLLLLSAHTLYSPPAANRWLN